MGRDPVLMCPDSDPEPEPDPEPDPDQNQTQNQNQNGGASHACAGIFVHICGMQSRPLSCNAVLTGATAGCDTLVRIFFLGPDEWSASYSVLRATSPALSHRPRVALVSVGPPA